MAFSIGRRIDMTRKPGDKTPEPLGDHAAERLREFIDQRFPGGGPSPEGAPEQAADAESDAAHGDSGQHAEARLARLEQMVQQLVQVQQRNEARLAELAEAQSRIESLLKERDSTK